MITPKAHAKAVFRNVFIRVSKLQFITMHVFAKKTHKTHINKQKYAYFIKICQKTGNNLVEDT